MENKTFWLLMATNLLSLVLVGCGILLALKNVEGWGWLIVAALMVYSAPSKLRFGKTKKN